MAAIPSLYVLVWTAAEKVCTFSSKPPTFVSENSFKVFYSDSEGCIFGNGSSLLPREMSLHFFFSIKADHLLAEHLISH